MNKKLRIKIISLIGIMGLVLTLISLSGCNKKYKVSFIVDDKTYEVVKVEKDSTVSFIDAPQKQDYNFRGWFDGDEYFDFTTKINKKYKLVAKYSKICENHEWFLASCSNPKTCMICGITEGDTLDHVYSGDCDTTCNECGFKRVASGAHEWLDATALTKKRCQICGITEGDVLLHVEEIITEFDEKTLYIGDSITINASVLPQDAKAEFKYDLKADKGAEYTFENNVLTVLKEGTIRLSITATDGSFTTKDIIINVVHPLLDLDQYEAFDIMTGFGSNASSDIEINYHTYNTKTTVEYTLATDVDFNNFSSVSGNGYYFTEGSDVVEGPFTPRNVYRVSLRGLMADTDYIYRINLGNNTYSEVYAFHTAPDGGGDSAFLLLSDVHYYFQENDDGTYTSHGSEVSENTIKEALALNPNIGFIATSGDMVDKGGDARCWDILFKKSLSLKTLPRIGVSGNHEYYINGTKQSDGRYQKAHYATAYNGPSTQLGLSSYFIYNDILFIAIDNEDHQGRMELIPWLEDILANTTYRYSFVMMHRPVNYDATTSSDRDEEMMHIFEKYAVDLVIAGHYHSDNYTQDYYEGATSTNEYLGVNYITLAFGGVKSRTENTLASGYLVETHDGTVSIKRINENGKLISQRTFTSKRKQEVIFDTKENLIASINGSYNSSDHTYTFNFSDKFYGNVKSVNIIETNREDINEDMYFPNKAYNKLVLENIMPYYEYNFKMLITFSDGTKEEVIKKVCIDNDIVISPKAIASKMVMLNLTKASSDLDMLIRKYAIYINDVFYKEINYLDDSYEPITSYQISNLNPNTNYKITFVALDRSNKPIYQKSVNIKTLPY